MNLEILAEIRTELGSKSSKKLRNNNKIPGVIYNDDQNPTTHISFDRRQFDIMFANKNLISSILHVKIDDKIHKLFIKDFQIDHVNQKIIHVDFIRVEKNSLVKAKVPIHYINKSKSIAIKKGAFLNIARYFVYLKCKGENIPSSLVVDLENTDVSKIFRVEDLNRPIDSEILYPNQLLCNFVSKRGKAIKE